MAESSRKNWSRLWGFRLAAVGLGLLPLLVSEWVLAVLDLPKRAAAIDPYVDLHHLRPLFELDEQSQKLSIGSERLHLFRPVSFLANKPEGTFRIFALGGSTTQGEPYSTETAFPEWLRLNLQAQMPGIKFEMINCGGLSYASYRVLAILREVLQYDPDLVIVYTGQNEFLERRTYENWQTINPYATTVASMSQLRTVRLVRALISGPAARNDAPTRTELSTEVDALLDYAGGLNDYHRDDPWREPVVNHFRWNVEQMILACRERQVPIALIRPVTNLIDCPPFKFEVDSSLSREEKEEFSKRWDALRESREQGWSSMAEVDALLKMDPQHAGALFLKGRLAADAGDWETAKRSFIAARDADVCPLRAITPILDVVTELAQRYEVPYVDAEQLLAERCEHHIPGSQWLVDHVHPTIEGHQLIGEALAELCVQQHWVTPTNSDWITHRKGLYKEHLSELGEAYFHRGKQRLEGLMLWTQGRAKKIKGGPQ